MTIRTLPSDVHVETFAALGAVPLKWDLTQALAAIVAGTIASVAQRVRQQPNKNVNSMTVKTASEYRLSHGARASQIAARPISQQRKLRSNFGRS